MTLFLPATVPALDANGNVLESSTWNFYYKGTLTPAATSEGETAPADDPAEITLEADITYRAVLTDSAGKVISDIGSVVDGLFSAATQSAFNTSNQIVSGAEWRFYLTGTDTPTSVYSDDTLAVPLGYRVGSDAAGRFPHIYLDEDVTHKAVLLDSEGDELGLIDPVTYVNMWLYLDPDAVIPIEDLEPLEPSADWNGTAATGFGAPYGDVPTDPTRTTAKPVCRLMVPPNQYFTDELVVGVWAGANNAGSLASNLGMTKVVAHFEGMTRDIVAPSFYNFTDVNGVARSYLGWWVTLKKPVGTAGRANVYFEAIPADATMQSRVIGPYQFSPQAALHDYSITVAATPAESAGVRYKTLDGALNYLRGVSAVNPLITFTEAGNYDINWILGSAYTSAAYCTITASAAVTFKKPSFSTSSTARLFRNGWDGLWFRGPNITIDYKDAAYIYHENPANRPHVFEGVNFIKSDGRDATFMLGTYGMQYLARDRPWYLECNISDVALPFAGADTVRGCTGSGGYDDFSSTNYTFVGNVCHDWNNGNWRTPINALTVQYSGAGTGTLEMSGGNNTAGRVLTAKVAGSSVGTFTLTADAAGFAANTNYTVQNVVTWLNTLTNWSATLLDNTRRAVALGKPGANPVGGAFSATDAKTAPLTLETVFDLHTDMWRLFTGTQENVVCADNVFYDCVGQGYWITSNGGTGLKDVIIVNNTMHQDTADPDAEFSYTQLADIQSHVVFAHNSLTQGINLRSASSSYNPDAYCLVSNNVSVFINWTGTADVNLTLKDNHLFTGGTVPTYATGTTIGGVDATLFASAATGNFTPIGALLTNLKTPVVARDLARSVRATPDAAGALGL